MGSLGVGLPRRRWECVVLGAAGALLTTRVYARIVHRWRSLPYAWRRAATAADVARWLLRLPPRASAVDATLALRRRYLCPAQSLSYANAAPLCLVGGSGARLYDGSGRVYLDTRNNVAHVGHGHAGVASAVAAALAGCNANTRYLHPNRVALAGRLLATTPPGSRLRDGVVFFVNSGSEANDLALRLIRAARGLDAGVAVLDHGYHGHTVGALALSPYKHSHPSFGGRGKPDWVAVADAPATYRRPVGGAAPLASLDGALDALEARAGGGGAVGGFFVESGMSVAGVVVAPRGYVRSAFAAVRRRGGFCVCDEVQTGLGRLGTAYFWASEAHGVDPDVVTVGKPFGNGFPLAAVLASRELSDAFEAGPEYFNTFGGSPAACAAGLAVLDAIESGKLRENADAAGGALRRLLAALAAKPVPARPPGAPRCVIGDVRGDAGLFLGVDLVRDAATREPATAEASLVCARLATEHSVLASLDGPHDNVLVVKPPLCFSAADAEVFVTALAAELDHVNGLPEASALAGHTPT